MTGYVCIVMLEDLADSQSSDNFMSNFAGQQQSKRYRLEMPT